MSVLDCLLEGHVLAELFTPEAHPRDFHGRFAEKVAALKLGEHVALPGGVSVHRQGKLTYTVRGGGRADNFAGPERAAAHALARHDSKRKAAA